MLKRLIIALFVLSLALGNGALLFADDATKAKTGTECHCGKDCKCEHCATGKGECKCHGGHDCTCGKDCKCEHCTTGKGECKCHKKGS